VAPAPASLEDLRIQFDGAREELELLVDCVVGRLREEIRRSGISAVVVEGRVKETASFLKKTIRKTYPDPWSDIRDKAGVRVTCTFSDDVATVEEIIRESFAVTHFENKVEQLGPSTFDYLGLHFEVNLQAQDSPGLLYRSLEIQLRTSVQTTWADVSHELLYKTLGSVSPANARSLHRLLALVESFDLEVKRVRGDIMTNPSFTSGRLLEHLEKGFLGLTGRAFDPLLSVYVVSLLQGALPELTTAEYLERVDGFVVANKPKLSGIYADYLSDERQVLISQPESLILFERLETDRFTLRGNWPN
jgi:ppGpp synthetase/RelA/SpoT-type nucleotidyltranferase